jgi:Phytanoyl-CoA dioxygenase (PhyH)
MPMDDGPRGSRGISAQERSAYERDGLVIPAFRLPESSRLDMTRAVDELLAATAGQAPESIVCPHVPGMNNLPENITRTWLKFCARPDVLDLVESLIGPDIVLWGSQVFCKPAATGMEVPWHQDGEYWPIRPLATCSVWIAIDDVSIENGAMRYLPGSHRARRLFPHTVSERGDLALNRVLDPTSYDPTTAAYDELNSGQLSLHDVYLIHGSAANTSGKRRAGFAIRYMPATSHFDRALDMGSGSQHFATQFATRPIYLMRGAGHSNTENVIDCRPH